MRMRLEQKDHLYKKEWPGEIIMPKRTLDPQVQKYVDNYDEDVYLFVAAAVSRALLDRSEADKAIKVAVQRIKDLYKMRDEFIAKLQGEAA